MKRKRMSKMKKGMLRSPNATVPVSAKSPHYSNLPLPLQATRGWHKKSQQLLSPPITTLQSATSWHAWLYHCTPSLRDWLWGWRLKMSPCGRSVQVKHSPRWFFLGLQSLTQFYSVDFSQSRIGVKKCVFNKRTIKVCVSYCWRCPGTSAPITAHLTMSLYLCSSGSNPWDGDEGVAGRNYRE